MKTNLQDTEKENKSGILYIVSTPIGNMEDITYRAVKVLKTADLIVCEDPKVGARLLHRFNITQKMDLLNEQNENSKTFELLNLLRQGVSIALMSDDGTPLLADPGLALVQNALQSSINVVVVPGPSSIITALVRSGFPINQFLFAGFLSRDKDERIAQLRRLSDETRTVVLLETPYRLKPVLEAAYKVMPKRNAYIGCNLTMPFETHHYGTFSELYNKFKDLNFKGEFVICFEGLPIQQLYIDNSVYEEKPIKEDKYKQNKKYKEKTFKGKSQFKPKKKFLLKPKTKKY